MVDDLPHECKEIAYSGKLSRLCPFLKGDKSIQVFFKNRFREVFLLLSHLDVDDHFFTQGQVFEYLSLESS